MSQVSFNVTREDHQTILQIVARANRLVPRSLNSAGGFDLLSPMMDIEATHMNGCPLKLEAWLAADDSNFAHDIAGIMSCIDRKTGKLTRSFVPRFAISEREQRESALQHVGKNETRDALIDSMGEQEFATYIANRDAGLPCADCGEECEAGKVFCSVGCRDSYRQAVA